MQLIRSEFGFNYSAYSFGYALYARAEEGDDPSDLLSAGFLPYSGMPLPDNDLYYMARSVRVVTHPFQTSSENRRVLRKFEEIPTQAIVHPAVAFDWDPTAVEFCLEYSRERFSNPLSKERFEKILSHPHLTNILEYQSEGQRIGLVFLNEGRNSWHYWFSFYDLDFHPQQPLGKYMMTQCLDMAAQKGIRYTYLGTCYGRHSLYKVRDFTDVSYFNGQNWSDEKKQLKALCKSDQPLDRRDLFQQGLH